MIFVFSVPIILVGNKTDLQSDRRVSQEQGKRLAEEIKAVFIETSAKENQVCFSIFLTIFMKGLTKYPIYFFRMLRKSFEK